MADRDDEITQANLRKVHGDEHYEEAVQRKLAAEKEAAEKQAAREAQDATQAGRYLSGLEDLQPATQELREATDNLLKVLQDSAASLRQATAARLAATGDSGINDISSSVARTTTEHVRSLKRALSSYMTDFNALLRQARNAYTGLSSSGAADKIAYGSYNAYDVASRAPAPRR